jgi:hypothetical protein
MTIHGIVEIIDSFHFLYPIGFYGVLIHCTLEVIIIVRVLSTLHSWGNNSCRCVIFEHFVCNSGDTMLQCNHWRVLFFTPIASPRSIVQTREVFLLTWFCVPKIPVAYETKGDILVNRLHLTNGCFQLHYLSNVGALLAWHGANIMPNLFILSFSSMYATCGYASCPPLCRSWVVVLIGWGLTLLLI